MAPAREAVYFPGIDLCLKRERALISWQTVSIALCDGPVPQHYALLDDFLRDETSRASLAQPLLPFSAPTSQSRSDFETKTAAINVLPSNNGQYDINQIKQDAQWLSKEFGVDEISALRIVVLEWQERATTHLQSDWPAADRAAKQDANASVREQTQLSFDTDEQRHARLFLLFCQEKTSILKVGEILVSLAQPPELQTPNLGAQPWQYDVAKNVWESQRSSQQTRDPLSFFLASVLALNDRSEMLQDTSKWPAIALTQPSLAAMFLKSLFTDMAAILRLALLHVNASKLIPSADAVMSWYKLMDNTAFFSDMNVPSPELNETLWIMQCLASVISTALLSVPQALEYLQATYAQQSSVTYPQLSATPYLESEDCLRALSKVSLDVVAQGIRQASPAVLAWSIVSQSLRVVALAGQYDQDGQFEAGSSDSDRVPAQSPSQRNSITRQTRAEILLEVITDIVPGEDPIAAMGAGAVNDLQVFESVFLVSDALVYAFGAPVDIHTAIIGKLVLLQLLTESMSLVQYGPEIVKSVLSVISYGSNVSSISLSQPTPLEPAKSFVEDTKIMGPRLLTQVRQRYPYELVPLLECLTTLSNCVTAIPGHEMYVVQLLDSMNSYTMTLPSGFNGYDLVQEDIRTNCIKLVQDLPLFTPRETRSRYSLTGTSKSGRDSLDAFYDQHVIPAGTEGVVVRDSPLPFVVRWDYQHSGLEYLGTLLATLIPSSTVVPSSGPLDSESTAEVVKLLATLIANVSRAGDLGSAKHVLGRLSYGLRRSDDIIRVISELFENELQFQMGASGNDGSLGLLVQCAKFLTTMLGVYPDRVWSYLVRSRLLSIGEDTGALAAIVGDTEIPLAQFDFLRSCAALFEALTEDAVKRAVSRKSLSKALTRFEDNVPSPGTTPEKTMTVVLTTFERIMVDVFQTQPSWRFENPVERVELTTSILRTFSAVLDYSHCIEDADPSSTSVTSVFTQPAVALLEVFLGTGSDETLTQPLLDIFNSCLPFMENAAALSVRQAVVLQAQSAFTFCDTVLKIGMMLDQKAPRFLAWVFQITPLLVKMYAAHHLFRAPVAALLTTAVRYADQGESEPPSLLGHLDGAATKSFLSVLSELDQQLASQDTEVKIWDLLSAVVSRRQQWLAISLLTGSTPRDRLESGDEHGKSATGRPLLSHALTQLSKIGVISPRRATAMLQFVMLAQSHWPWATNDIRRHPDFVPNITTWLAELTPNTRTSDAEAAIRNANENQMAAYISDILAMFLHNARSSGDLSAANAIAPKLHYLRDHGVAVDGYNHSLHQNLERNFKKKYPGSSLASFKRAALNEVDFGRDYFYDLGLADKILDFDVSWRRGNRQGFIDEIARANINLSVVQSQVALLNSWKGLATELCNFAGRESEIQKDLAKVVANCLKANTHASVPVNLFDNIAQVRANLAFVLLQKLAGAKSTEIEVRGLFAVAWDAVRLCGQDFEVVSTSKDADYYRSVLRILLLSLQVHNAPPKSSLEKPSASTRRDTGEASPAMIPALLEILQKVITVNFRALCSSAHADPSNTEPSDFVLLTALLQTVLRSPSISSVHAKIADIFADANIIRYATSLYSWSSSLASTTTATPGDSAPDPVYGELSILFLLSLSAIPPLAEQMAVDGLLSHLSSAPLSRYLSRPAGSGPFAAPTRVHSIWTKGLLPLCLNLLAHVGAPIAPEVAGFLNAVPTHLARAVRDLGTHAAPSSSSSSSSLASLREPHAGAITLGLAAETHALALVAAVLRGVRATGAAAGLVGVGDVLVLAWDGVAAREEIEGLLISRRALRERIVPVGEREAEWARRAAAAGGSAGGAESVLEEKIVLELEAALECLKA